MQSITIQIIEDDKLMDKLFGELRQYFVNQDNRYKLVDASSSGDEYNGTVDDLTGKKIHVIRNRNTP